MHFEVGIDPQHFLMGSKMKSWTIYVQMGAPKTIGSDVPNLMKNVPNFVKDVPSIPKCVPRWRSASNHFLMGLKMKSWTIHVQMGVPKTIGLDVPHLMKNVPNFMNDVPRVPKCLSR